MLYNLFSYPVSVSKINADLYNKKEIIDTIERNYKKDSTRNTWDRENRSSLFLSSNLHQSLDDEPNPDFELPNYNELLPLYNQKIIEYFDLLKFTKDIKYSYKIVSYTCMTNAQYMASHYHNDSDFTAVHYIKFDDKEHTPTIFENKSDFVGYVKHIRPNLLNLLDKTDIKNSWLLKNWKFNIKEDDICITPSLLHHCVEKQNSKNTRIAIVLNITIE